ncbi:MAG: hypothetical protein ABI895_27210 [Deltaproteobacteria bacterium]
MIRKAISVLLLVATLLGLYNVYADSPEVKQLAERTACGNAGCVRLLRSHRTPMGQDFEFQTSVQPPRSLEVHCARSFVLLGSYDCAGQSAAH